MRFSIKRLFLLTIACAVLMMVAKKTIRYSSCEIVCADAGQDRAGWCYELAGWGYVFNVYTGDVPLPLYEFHRMYKQDGSRFWSIGWSR